MACSCSALRRHVVDGVGLHVRAQQHGRGTELGGDIELASYAVQDVAERLRRDPLDVPDGLEQVDGQPEVRAAERDLARAQR